MPFMRPKLWNMSSSSGYALQFASAHNTLSAILRSGECYVKPIFAAPTVTFSTTSASTISAGATTLVVASATNIKVGTYLLVDSGSVQENVLVTSVSGTTIGGVFANAHDGSGTVFAITGTVFSAAPTGTPAPGAGVPADGWWHLSTAGEKRTLGADSIPQAGSPLFPGGSYDRVYGVLIWTITAGELELNAH